ncbi:unnamed protein product [Ostreobium quekettii]|uniref:Xrn1 helical domain-containing protein n=1 Tax=Ostreobium quekettii TaxID=121088 RepID=A0A8S1IQ66_9CHLO|nr:unnamed protein product [Ostreobium quekettii]
MESVRMQRQDGSQDSSDVSSSNPPLTNHEDIWKTMESIGKKDDKNPFKLPAETVSGEASAEKAAKLQKEFESKINGIMKEKGDKFDEMMEHDANMALGEEGYKDRYYKSKFPHHKNLQEVKDGMVTAYVEGLCWVMGYYYDGVPSWRWFYPYHYAPFTSDLCQMSHIQPCFELAKPFDPIQQLMSVLPAGSRHSLPEPLQHLFISKDSPIKDFYPSDFEQDMNGKRYLWQAVALLPFIDEDRLVKAMEPHMSKLTPEEKERNTTKPHQLYLHSAHSLAPAVREMACTMKGVPGKQRFQSKVAINPGDAKGMSGFIGLPAGDHCPSVVQAPFKLGKDIMANRVLRIVYFYPPHKMHQARLLEGAYLPECSVDVGDIPPENPLWHEKDRMRRQGRPHDAPFLGDAARRHIHHNLDRGPFRQSAPSPTNIPSGVTEAALRAANSKPLNPQAPPFPPENVTQLAIRMSRQQQLQGYAEQVSNGQSPPLAQFQTGLWLAGGANVGHSGQIPEMMTGAGPAANTGIPQGTYWDGSQLVNRLYAFGQQSYGQQAEGQQPFGLQGCSASFMDEGAGMNGYVDNNGAVAGYHQSKSEGVQRLEGAARYNWQQQDLLRNSDGFGRSSSSHRGRRGRGRR